MYILWALLSALLAASRRLNDKKLAQKMHPITMSFATQLLALPLTLAVTLLTNSFVNPLHLGWHFWVPLVIDAATFPLSTFLYLSAIKHSELSTVLPIQSLWPILTLLPAWFLLRETPSFLAIIGILLTVGGVYALGLKGRQLHHPLAPFRAEKSSRYMLFSVLLTTTASIIAKVAISNSNAIFYSLASTTGVVIALYLTLKLWRIEFVHDIKAAAKSLSIAGSLQGASYTSYLIALAAGPVAYVTTIRSSNVLIGSLLGIAFFKEQLTKPKIISFCLIALGGILLALG